jgi:ABC transporter substrate binding protein (PQQ-dependent alcohol dehydrogenase system)
MGVGTRATHARGTARQGPSRGRACRIVLLTLAVAVSLGLAMPACAQQAPPGLPAPAASAVSKIAIVLAREQQDRLPPLSLLDLAPDDDGIAGARLAINDNNTTGRFLKQEFTLDVVQSASVPELVAEVTKRVDAGAGFVIVDASPVAVLALADALKGRDVLLLNAGSADDRLRGADCRANVVHTAPSRTMLADGLAQYLVWKQWRRWLLVRGTGADDEAYAQALRRAAQRFGAKIVEERTFKVEGGSRRADGGHEQIQQQIPLFTQNAPAYDVLMLADESGQFGEYFPYRTWDARPVAGTQGLTPMSWHPALEQWGGTQFQNRFQRLAKRPMRALDYDVWMAVRSIGEAATRTKSTDAKALIAYLKSDNFEVAAFKGRKLTYRAWNGQLRQPILVGTAKLPVTVSPQPGFLHQVTELDTLGVDRPETACKGYAQ